MVNIMGIWRSKRHHLHERLQEEKKIILEGAAEKKLINVFHVYASVVENGVAYMTAEDFLVKYLRLLDAKDYNEDTATFLFGAIDRSKRGRISYEQFREFEAFLRQPDCFYRTVFRLFDRDGDGRIRYGDFEKIMRRTSLHTHLPYDNQLRTFNLYFGHDRTQFVRYEDFNQMLISYYRDVADTAFEKADHFQNGTIPTEDFYNILLSTKGHMYSEEILLRASEIADKEENYVRYSNFIAIDYLLSNMEMVKRIYLLVTDGNKDEFVTQDEFMHSAQLMSPMTPLEVSILFQLCLITRPAPIFDKSSEMDGIETDEAINYDDLRYIAPEQHYTTIAKRLYNQRKYIVNEFVRDQYYNDDEDTVPIHGDLIAGATAGFVQACFSNPLEVIKIYFQTHTMENNRERLRYKQVYRYFGGIRGFYQGFLGYLVRDVPFNAMYFTTYYWMKKMTRGPYGENSALSLVCAGGLAGIPAAIFVTPFDVIKGRTQIQRPNEKIYKNCWDAAKHIYQMEGLVPFSKGLLSRVLKFSPQFGITLFAFEKLENVYYREIRGERRKKRAELRKTPPNPDHVGGYAVANLTFDAIEKKFGLLFPKGKIN